MTEKILFEYRAHEPGENSYFKFKSYPGAWNACGPVFMSCCEWQADSKITSQGMKHGKLDDTLAFFEGMYRDLYGGEESA
jgi:hypothetical protein